MKLDLRSALAGGLIAALLIADVVIGRRTVAAEPAGKALEGFTIGEVRFDESTGGKKPTPTIPKRWKFVGVGNGDAINGSILWFQDADGTLYAIHGFASGSKFIVYQRVQKLAVGE